MSEVLPSPDALPPPPPLLDTPASPSAPTRPALTIAVSKKPAAAPSAFGAKPVAVKPAAAKPASTLQAALNASGATAELSTSPAKPAAAAGLKPAKPAAVGAAPAKPSPSGVSPAKPATVFKKPTSFGTPGMAFQGFGKKPAAGGVAAGSPPANQGLSTKTNLVGTKPSPVGAVNTGAGGISTLRKKWEHVNASDVSDAKIVMCEKYNLQSLLKLWRSSIVKVQSGAYEVIENLIETPEKNGLGMAPSKLNGFRPLVDITKNYEDDIQLNAVWALAKLAAFSGCQQQIMTEVGWHNIRKFVAAPEQDMIMACSLLLSNLSQEKNNQQGIIEKGVPMLMERLNNPATSVTLKSHLLSAFGEISTIKEHGAKQIWESELLPIVLPAVQDDKHPEIQFPAIACLKNICQSGGPAIHDQVVKSGVLEMLVGLLSDHGNPTVLRDITFTLAYIAKSDSTIREIETLSGYRAVINLLDSTDVSVQYGVAHAIDALADSSLSGSSLKRDGVVEPLKELIFATPSIEVEELALQALYKLDSEAWRITSMRLQEEPKKNRGSTLVLSKEDKKKAEELRLKYEAEKAAKNSQDTERDEAERLKRDEEEKKRQEERKRQQEEDRKKHEADLALVQSEKEKQQDELNRIADQRKKREEEDAKAEADRRMKMDKEKEQHATEIKRLEDERKRKAEEAQRVHEEAEQKRAQFEEQRRLEEAKWKQDEEARAAQRRRDEEERRRQDDEERRRLDDIRRAEREASMLDHRVNAEEARKRREEEERKHMMDRLAKEEELHRAKLAMSAQFDEERRRFEEEKRRFEADKLQAQLLQKQRDDEYALKLEKDRIEKEIEARKQSLENDRLAEDRRRMEGRLKEEQDRFKKLQDELSHEKSRMDSRKHHEADLDRNMMDEKMRALQDMLDRERQALRDERARLEKLQKSVSEDDKLKEEKMRLEHEIEIQKLQAEKKKLGLEKDELEDTLERERKKHDRHKREMELDNEIKATKDQFAQDRLIRNKIDEEMKALRALLGTESGSLEEERQKISAWKEALEEFQKEKMKLEADKADFEERKTHDKEYDRSIADLDRYILDKERAKMDAEKSLLESQEAMKRSTMSLEVEKLRSQLDEEARRSESQEFISRRQGETDDDYNDRLRGLQEKLRALQAMLEDEQETNARLLAEQNMWEADNNRLESELQRALDEIKRARRPSLSAEEKQRLEEEKARLLEIEKKNKEDKDALELRREALMDLLQFDEEKEKEEPGYRMDIFLKLAQEVGFEEMIKQMAGDREEMKTLQELMRDEAKKLEEWREEKRKNDEDLRRGYNAELEKMKEKRLSIHRNEVMAMADIVAKEKELNDREAKLKQSEGELLAAKTMSPAPRFSNRKSKSKNKDEDGAGRDRKDSASDSDYDSSRSRSRSRGRRDRSRSNGRRSSRSRSRSLESRASSFVSLDRDRSRSRSRSPIRKTTRARARSDNYSDTSGWSPKQRGEVDYEDDGGDRFTDNSDFYDEINDKLAERSRGGYVDTNDDFDGGLRAVDEDDDIAFSVEGLAVSDPHKATRKLLRSMQQDNTRSIAQSSVETLRRFAKMRSGDPTQQEARELIPVLLNVINVYNDTNHADVIGTALLILAILCWNKEANQLFILKANGGPTFFGLLNFAVANVRARAALAIAAYCLNNTYIKREMSKAIPRLVGLFQTATEENIKKGISAALASIADDYKYNQDKIRSKGGVRALLLHIANNQLPPRYALHLLSALARKNSSVQVEVGETYPDVFRKIVRLMSPYSKTYILTAAVACSVELSRKNGSNQRGIYKAGALPYLVHILTSSKYNTNHDLVGNCLFLIWAIAKRIGVTSPEFRSPAGGTLAELVAPLKAVKNEAVQKLIVNIEGMLRAPRSHA